MNNQETIDLLYHLKLKGMSEAFKAISIMPVSERPEMELAIAKIAEAERMYRDGQRTQMYLKTSKLRFNASLEAVTLWLNDATSESVNFCLGTLM